MDNFCILIVSHDETSIQEFTLPLNQEKVESWSSMINISFLEVDSDFSKLFSEKKFSVQEKKLGYYEVQPLKCYLLTGTGVNKNVDLKVVATLMILTEKSREETISWLEIFPGLEKAYCEYLLTKLYSQEDRDLNSIPIHLINPLDLKAYDVLEASKEGKLEKLETLFSQDFINPYCTDLGGKTPLHLAASCNKVNIVDFICKSSKKDMMHIKAKSGDTPLDYAITTGHFEVAKVLMSNGADFKSIRPDGKNMLHQAVKTTNTGFNRPGEIIDFLISKGIDINQKETCFGQTPLHVSIQFGDLKIIQCLLDHGANPNIQDCLGKTPAHYAKEMGRDDVYNLLIGKTNLSLRDILGNTPKKTSKPLFPMKHVAYDQIYFEDREKPVYAKGKGLLKGTDSAQICTFTKYPIANTEETVRLFKELVHQYDWSFFFSHVGCMNLIHGFCYHDGIFYATHPSSHALDHVKAKLFTGKMDMALKMVKALEFIHNQGIVARNISSENARAIQHSAGVMFNWSDVGITLPTKCIPEEPTVFDAPEVIDGHFHSTRSDIFALGAIIFEIVFEHPLEIGLHVQMSPTQTECFHGLMSLFQDMRATHPEDRPTIREVHDRLIRAKLEFILKGLQNGEYKHVCGCPKVHPFEELLQVYSIEAARVTDENERNQKRFMFRDDRQFQVIAESGNEAYVFSKWNDFLEKHIKKCYLDSTKKELTKQEVDILTNVKKFIFEEPANDKLFTIDSVNLLEKLVYEMTDIFTCLDLLRYLVLNPISLDLLIHTNNKIFSKIFSLSWKDQKKNTKVFIIRLFANLLGRDVEAISFCQDINKLNKIISFACMGLLDSERKALLPPTVALCQNLMILAPHLPLENNPKVWDNLIGMVINVIKDLPEDEYKPEKKALLLILYRFVHGYSERIKKTSGVLTTLEGWMIGGNLHEAVLEIYRYEEFIIKKKKEHDE